MAASPEIRFRLDRREQQQFEAVAQAIGMDTSDMVKVFIRRAIAAGGFPFEMRLAPAQDTPAAAAGSDAVHGVPLDTLSSIGARAARAAHDSHVHAGRLPPTAPASQPNSS